MYKILDIEKEEIVVVVIRDKSYSEDLTNLIRQLAEDYSGICYVTLNKQAYLFAKNLEDKNINASKFLFIDTASKASKLKELENCIYISSIFALNELSIAITLTIEKRKFDIMVFDSLSTMLIYHDIMNITKFVHNLIGKLREVNCGAIFTCLEADAESPLIKDLGMLVDKIVSLSEEKIKDYFDTKIDKKQNAKKPVTK